MHLYCQVYKKGHGFKISDAKFEKIIFCFSHNGFVCEMYALIIEPCHGRFA